MSFYYPLTLGVRRPKSVDTKPGQLPLRQPYETWREGVERYTSVYEECPEAQVLTRLQQRAPAQRNRLWLILGEPGAGKTTLLETWFTRWAAQLPAVRLGMVVPVFVRLRYVQVEQGLHESDRWADQLWALGLQEQALLEGQGYHMYQPDRRRWFQPVWLLDGLDEVTPPPSEHFYQALVNLPGLKVLSCRTAVYETLRREADRYKDQEYELLGLKPADQKCFLTHVLNGDAHHAEALHENLQRNAQLRLLAGNPLMLSLIAQVSDQMELPMTRAAFYQAAVSELWRRRLTSHREARFRTRERDQVLTELARRMGMARLEAPLAWLEDAASRVAGADGRLLVDFIENAGLVRCHPWEQVDFVHLTFQEFYLAQALKEQSLPQVLQRYWDDARYEETLGLLIAMLFQEEQCEAIDQGLRWLVEWGEATHRRAPHVLWRRRRSPLRVAFHLLHRAGVPLEHLPLTAGMLWEKVHESAERRLAAVVDAKMPPHVLRAMAQDAEAEVRASVARNPSAPPEALAWLAQDAEAEVRRAVAWNCSAPPEALTQLAQDTGTVVRWAVARNPSAPPEALAWLAQDAEAEVRKAMAENSDAPPELLTQLARDAEVEVRWAVARSRSAPPELLIELAQDTEAEVRKAVAWNRSAPPKALIELAQDDEIEVRWGVAENAGTLPEVLARLAEDAEARVRRGVALNPSAPPELLIGLTQDTEIEVRGGVAWNPSTPPEALARLARDTEAGVRGGVAENHGAPPEFLAQLAQDAEAGVRGHVAWNPSTPPEALARLARDDEALAHNTEAKVCRGVAWNPSTPPEALARLAEDAEPWVRLGVALNPSAPPETLVRLARDIDPWVREHVARNPSASPEALARLARDTDGQDTGVHTRHIAIVNPNTLLENL